MNALKPDTTYATLGDWSLMKKLGSGATSRVYLAYNTNTRRYAAIKVLKKMSQKTLPLIKNEVSVQGALNHVYLLNIQKYHESIVLTDAEGRSQAVTAVVLDLARGGDILKLIEKIGVFPEQLARTYLHQLVEALEYLEKQKIAHRDIKPENIMLDEDYCVKLADFGCAGDYADRKYFKTPCGTSKYFPPEEHLKLPYEGKVVDIFAVAVVLFAMAVGHMPFSKAVEEDSLYAMLIDGKAKNFWKAHEDILKDSRISMKISNDFKDMMTRMLDPMPERRLTVEEIKKSAWYKGSVA